MPIRGESVGTAYIRVVADGSSIPSDIEDEFDEVNKVADRQGSKFAKRFKKGVGEELEKHDKDSLENAIVGALSADKAAEKFFSGSDWNRVKTRFNQEWGALGDSEIKAMEERFLRKGSLDGIEDALHSSVSRINADFIKLRAKADAEAQVEAARVRKLGEDFRAVWDDVSDDSDKAGNAITRFFGKLRSGNRDASDTATTFGRLGRTIDHIGDGVGRTFGKGSRSELLNFTGSFVAGSIKLLGIVPKILDNITQFGKGFQNALASGQGFFKAVSGGFQEMGKDADGAATSVSGLFSSFSQLAVTLPVLAAVLAGVALIIGIIVHLVAALSAAVIALAGSISFAVIGALAPLVGLLAPLAVGLGVVAAGILAITQNAKALDTLKAKFKPLLDDVKQLGDTFVHGFIDHLDVSGATLEPVVKRLHDLFANTGAEIGNIVDRFTQGFNSPEFTDFIDQVTLQVPRQLDVWSRIVQNIGRILSALFIDLRGPVARFDNAVQDITDQFADWLNTTAGRQAVLHFLDQAGDSAQAVGGFLVQVSKILGTFLSGGKSTGDSIFASLTRQAKKFLDFIKPKGGKTIFDEQAGGIKRFAQVTPKTDPLGNFFKSGKSFADNVGKIIGQLARLTKALDEFGEKGINPNQGKNKLGLFISSLQLIKEFFKNDIGGPIKDFGEVIDGASFSIRKLHDLLNITIIPPDLGSKIKAGLGNAGSAIKNFFHGLSQGGGSNVLAIHPPSVAWIGGVESRIGHFFSHISTAASNVSFSGLVNAAATAARNVVSLFTAVPNELLHLAGRFTHAAATWVAGILGEISEVPNEIVSFFTGLGKRIVDAIGPVVIHIATDIAKSPFGPLGGLGDRIFHAKGGIFDKAQIGVFGEAGAEALVPLTGPLSAVDPSVRELSAIARGLRSGSTSSVQTPAGKTINVEQNISTPATDPLAAASEFLNYLTAVVA